MVIIYTNYDWLVDATCQVSCKSPNHRFGPVVLKNILKAWVHNIYEHGGHLGHVPYIMPLNFIFLV